jgi:chemotaxis signal transduction protein
VLVAGNGMTIGLRVDEVLEVRSIQTSDIGPPLVERSADRADIHTGLTKDLIAVVDVEALLADRALVVQEGFDLS